MTLTCDQEKRLRSVLHGKKAMITGGLGMIGSTIAHGLVKYGAEVTIVDACIEPYGAKMANLKGIRDRVQVSITDIRDREAIKALVKDKDYIFNLAGQVSHNDSIVDPFRDADINYIGHLTVAECVRQYNPSAKILYSGSRLQYGAIDHIPVSETHPLRPKTPYAFNKTVAENMYRFYYEQYGIRTVTFRITNPYGMRCQMQHARYSIVNYFIRLAMEDKPILVYGDGSQLRDYVYVEDLATAFLLGAAEEMVAGEVFNLGSGAGTRFIDMARCVVDVVGSGSVESVPWPADYLKVETGDYVADTTKIRQVLDWVPAVSLPEGISLTVDFYRKNRHEYF